MNYKKEGEAFVEKTYDFSIDLEELCHKYKMSSTVQPQKNIIVML